MSKKNVYIAVQVMLKRKVKEIIISDTYACHATKISRPSINLNG